jgi:hypothetical protein
VHENRRELAAGYSEDLSVMAAMKGDKNNYTRYRLSQKRLKMKRQRWEVWRNSTRNNSNSGKQKRKTNGARNKNQAPKGELAHSSGSRRRKRQGAKTCGGQSESKI